METSWEIVIGRLASSQQCAVRYCRFVQLNHSTYSLDHDPGDYYLLRNLKYHLHGNQFADDESLKAVVEAWFG